MHAILEVRILWYEKWPPIHMTVHSSIWSIFHPNAHSVCCWCVALYLLLVTCFLVLMAMVAVYFGYNMVRMSGDYNQRLDSLEDKIGQLSSRKQTTVPAHCVYHYRILPWCKFYNSALIVTETDFEF